MGKFVRIENIKEGLVKDWGDGDLQNSSDYSCYNISDEDKNALKETHAKYAHFPITHLVHDTKMENVLSILTDGKMRKGREKKYKISNKEQSYHFSWWGLAFDENQTEKYRNPMADAIDKILKKNNSKQGIELLSSHPFSGTAKERYGPWRFSVPVDELLKCYKESIGEYQTRILCTEVYTYEVMHTILVHPASMKGEFEDLGLPTLDEYMTKEPNPVVSKNGDQWIWHPQSTSVRHPDIKRCKQWDHLTFAFLIPEEKHISKIENVTERDNVPDREDSDHELEDPANTPPGVSNRATLPPTDCPRIHTSNPYQHPPSPQSSTRQTSPSPNQAAIPCDGLAIPFKFLIGKLQNLKVQGYKQRVKNKNNVIALLDKVSKQMALEKFKLFIERFWNIIQDKLSEGNLSVARDQCAYIQKLIQIFREKFGKIYPEKLPKQKEKFLTAIKDIWKVVENKFTEEQLIADAKDSGSKTDYQLYDGIEALEDVFKDASKLTLDLFPEEFPGFGQNMLLSLPESVDGIQPTYVEINEKIWQNLWETIPVLAKRHKDMVENDSKKLSPEEIEEEENKIKVALHKFWDITQDNISKGKLPEMKCQCENIQKLIELINETFGKIFPMELPKHEKFLLKAIVKVWNVIQTEQTLVAEEKTINTENLENIWSVVEDVLEIMKKLPLGEFADYSQIIEQVAQTPKGNEFAKPHQHYFYPIAKNVLVKFWDIIQRNLSEANYNTAITETLLYLIEKLIKSIRENFGKIPEQEENLRAAIKEIWKVINTLINTGQTEDNLYKAFGSHSYSFLNGVGYLQKVIGRFLELILNSLPPEDLLNYTENIKLSVTEVNKLTSVYVKNTKLEFVLTTQHAIEKVWDKIPLQDNLAGANIFSEIKNQCDIIEKFIELIKFIAKYSGKYVNLEKLAKTIDKVLNIILDKVDREHLMEEGRQTKKDKNDTDALADGIGALRSAVEGVFKLGGRNGLDVHNIEGLPESMVLDDHVLHFLYQYKSPDLEKEVNRMDIVLLCLNKQSSENNTFSNEPLEDGIICLRNAVRRMSKIPKTTLSPEELLDYCQNIQQSRQAVRSRKETNCCIRNNYQEEFDKIARKVVDRIWNTMQDINAISEMWKTIESKQTKLVAESKQDTIEPVSKLTHKAPCQFLFNIWDIIQSNISEENYPSVLRNQCDHIEKLMELTRNKFKEIFPEEILQQKETELQDSINKIWRTIHERDLKEFATSDAMSVSFKRVSELVMKTLPPEKWPNIPKEVKEKFWVVIESNLSEGNYLYEIRNECDHIEKLTKDIQDHNKIGPEDQEMQKHKQKIQVAIKLVEDSRQGKEDQPFQNFMDAVYSVVENISKLIGNESEEDIQEKCQNVLQSLQAVKDKPYSPDFDQKFKAIVNKLPDIIQRTISEKKELSVIKDQCCIMERLIGIFRKNFGEIFPAELGNYMEKLRACFAKARKVIEDKYTSKEMKEYYRCFKPVSDLTAKWFPEEYPVHCHNILQSVQSAMSEQSSDSHKSHLEEMSQDMVKKLMETVPRLANGYQDTVQKNLKRLSPGEIKEKEKIKATLLQFWNVIEISVSVGKLSTMRDQCNNIKELIELIREEFGKILPEELSKHEEKVLRVAIVKVFEVIKTGQTKEKLIAEGKLTDKNKDVHEALEHGMRNIFSVIEDVLEIMRKLPPEEFLGYCQVIKRSQLAVEDEKSYGIDFIDPHSRYLHQVSREVLFKLWSIIQDNLSEKSYLSVIPNQCDHITKLIRIIRDNFGKAFLKEHQTQLRKSIEKLWILIQTKQTKENLVADGRRGNKNKEEDEALAHGINILGDVIELVSELTMKTLPTEEFPGYCQKIQRSRQAVQDIQSNNENVNKRKNEVLSTLNTLEVKYQKAIDQFQLNKQKRKCESEDDSETPLKRKCEPSGDDGTSEKRQRESSGDDGTSEKRQRESSGDDGTSEKRQRESSGDDGISEKRQRESSGDDGTSEKRQCESSDDGGMSLKRSHESSDDDRTSEKRQRLDKSPHHGE